MIKDELGEGGAGVSSRGNSVDKAIEGLKGQRGWRARGKQVWP